MGSMGYPSTAELSAEETTRLTFTLASSKTGALFSGQRMLKSILEEG